MYENEGGAFPKDTLNSKIATGCTQSEFAQRSTRSTRPRRKIILGPTHRIEELQGTWNNAVDYRILGIPLSTVEQQDTKRQNKVKKLIEKFEPPAQGLLPSGLEPDAEDQQVQQRIEGIDRRHDQHRDLRALGKLFQTAMPRLQNLLGKSALSIAVVEENSNLRRDQKSSKRTTTTSPQSLAM